MSKNFSCWYPCSYSYGRKSFGIQHRLLSSQRRFLWLLTMVLAGFCLLLGSAAVRANVTVTVTGAGTVCAGSPVTLTANYTTTGCEGTAGNPTYQWYSGSLSSPIPGATAFQYTYTPSSSATLFCQVAVGNCGTNSGSAAVSVTPTTLSGNTPTHSPNLPSTCDTILFNEIVQETCDSGTLTYSWNFGDGTPLGSGPSPQHRYLNSGPETVKVTVSDGTHSPVYSTTVNVSQGAAEKLNVPPPTVSINPATTCQAVTFNVAASEACGNYSFSYNWNFDDPVGSTSATSLAAVPTYTYKTAGTHHVTVIVTDSANRQVPSGVLTVNTSVPALSLPTPTASNTTPTTCQAVTFNVNPPPNCAGDTWTYTWNFNDSTSPNNSATGQTATHTFAATGAHTVTVTAKDSSSNQASSTVSITASAPTISLPTPIPTPNSPTTCDVVSFSASPTETCDSPAWIYAWNFGDPTSASNTSALASPTHQFAAPGHYTISLQVTDSVTGLQKTNATLVLSVGSPVIAAAPTNVNASSGCAGEVAVTWTASAGASSYTVYRSVNSGSYAKLTSVTGTSYTDFTAPASMTSCYYVTAANKCGTEGPASVPSCAPVGAGSNVLVTLMPQTASLCIGQKQTFSANFSAPSCEATGPPAYAWYVDGVAVTNTGSTYAATFSQTGPHTVSVRVMTVCGDCGSGPGGTAKVTVVTPGITIKSAGGAPVSATTCDPVQFTVNAAENCSSGATLAYSWSFGDSSPPSTLQNPSHTYAAPPATGNSYPVSVTVSDGVNPPAVMAFSQQVSQGSAPAADTNLTATTISATEIDLNWTASAGSRNHAIYRATNGGGYTNIGTAPGSTYQDTTVLPGNSYSYYVTAANGCGSGAASSPYVASTPDFGLSDNASSLSMTPSSSANSTITVVPGSAGSVIFSGAVALNVSPALPAGVRATFTVNPTRSATTLTLSASSSALPGTYPLTIQGAFTNASGTTQHTASLSLIITTAPDFNLSASPGELRAVPGQGTSATVSVQPLNGFTGSVSLSAPTPVSGAVITFSPASAAASVPSTMTVNLAASTAPGTYLITITGTGGGISRTTTVGLTVLSAGDFLLTADPSDVSAAPGGSAGTLIAVTPFSGFSGSVLLTVLGLPTGVSPGLNPLVASNGNPSAVALSVANSVAIGSYNLTVEGTAYGITRSVPVTLWISRVADFKISTSPAQLTLKAGTQDSSTITSLSGLNGFTGSAALSFSGAPTGVLITPSASSVSSASPVSLTISVGTGTLPGVYNLIVTGTQGSLVRNATLSLTVSPPPPADFSLSANPSIVTIPAGGTATSAITVNPINGFTGTVSLTGTSATSGITAAPATASPGTPGSLTISVASSVTPNTYTLQVTGTSGTLSHGTTITVTVGDFSLSANPSAVTVQAGTTGSSVISVVGLGGFNGSVGLTASGMPSGVTAGFAPLSVGSGGTSTLTFTVPAGTPAGSYPVTVTGTASGATRTTTVTLNITDFALSAAPNPLSSSPGGSALTAISVIGLNGFSGSTALSLTNPPAGIAGFFNPASVTASAFGAFPQSALTLTIGTNVAPGTYNLVVTGVSGGVFHTVPITLYVAGFSLSASPATLGIPVGQSRTVTVTAKSLGTYSGTVSLTTSGAPAGVTVTPTSTSVSVTSGSPGSSLLKITVAATAAAGTYPLTVTGTDGNGVISSTTISLAVTDFLLNLNLYPATLGISPGGTGTADVEMETVNGYNATVALTGAATDSNSQPVPAITAGFLPPSVSDTTTDLSTMTVTVPASVVPGTYTMTVTGSDPTGTPQHSVPLTILVAGFGLTATPSSLSIPLGQTKTATIAVSGIGSVALTAAGMPPGMVPSFSQTTVSGGGSSTLTVQVSSAVPTGFYPLTITGTSGSITSTTTVTVEVTDFVLSAIPSTTSAPPGGSGSTQISITPVGSFADQVNLTSSCPPGLSTNFSTSNIVGGGTTTLSITATSSVAPGTYTVTVFGQDIYGAPLRQTPVTLTVASFTVTAAPSYLNMLVGQSKSTNVTVSSIGSFSGPVTLSATGLPPGVTPSFAAPGPNVTVSGGNSTACVLTLNASSSALPGTYSVVVTGTDQNGYTASAALTVDVADFTLSANPPALTVPAGTSGTVNISLLALGNLTGQASLTLTNPVGPMPVWVNYGFVPQQLGPAGVSVLTFTALPNAPPGVYPLVVTGTDGTVIRTTPVTLTVSSPRTWTVGAAIQGGVLTLPANHSAVAPGGQVACSVTQATDTDHWVDAANHSGDDPDVVTYSWTCSGGSFQGDTSGQTPTWIAPSTPGSYTISCVVDDLPTAVVAPDTGTRDDPALATQTVTVLVQDTTHRIWTVGTPITGGQIVPLQSTSVALGASVSLGAGDATDTDHWQEVDGTGTVLEQGDDPDVIVYHWTCTSGSFLTGYDMNNNPQYGPTSTSQYPTWVAPATVPAGGTATLSCVVDDQPTPVVAPDTGTRDDPALALQNITVTVVDASAQRVASLQYSTDGKDDTNPAKTWTAVPQSGQTGYPLTVNQGDDVEFKAIKATPSLPWPDSKPVWGGEAASQVNGATSSTVDVVFINISANATDFKLVTAECSNTVTASVLVNPINLVSLTTDKSNILVAGGSALAQTVVHVVATDYNNNPIANDLISLASFYADGNGSATSIFAGSLSATSLTTDSLGQATAVFTSGTDVGEALLTAAAHSTNGVAAISNPTAVLFDLPTATVSFGAWQTINGVQKSLCTVTVYYGDNLVPNRVISLQSRVTSDPAGNIPIIGYENSAPIESPNGVTNADGVYNTYVDWNPPVNPLYSNTQVYIWVDIFDTNVTN